MGVVEDFKQGQRRMWASGDFPSVATLIQEASDAVVERLEIEPRQELLDVATGTGNAAVPAARLGARVVGLDLVPKLLDAARARAAAAGVEIDFVEGDAEALPFEDASFDRVSSVFGVMFAPRHAQAAGELVRVARPGARIVVAGWTPEGLNGQMFKTFGAHMPQPPPELQSPVLWGSEDHVRELFDDPRLEVGFERRTLTVAWESTDGWVSHCEEVLGPTITAKAALEPQGRWDAARADLVDLYERYNEADDGTLNAPAEYLVTVVEVSGD
ncbi:MAG TPA: class I SAM-dependent methyltransferase [Thermoleophilaceae bacterium]|nr:class I SAM-dependent methyltransferase [Thermoleophilaceae bacterium]